MSTSSARHSSLEQHVEIETPEQIVFSYSIAGIGTRAAALLVDYALLYGSILAVWVLGALLVNAMGLHPGRAMGRSGGWVLAVLMLLFFVIQWGYFVLFEAIWDGQTPGKRRLGIRVVQDGGYSVSFAASAVRNLARLLDGLPGPYAVAVFSAMLSKTGKRLGDMMAGTIVVQERVQHLTAPAAAAARAEGEGPRISAALTNEEYELLERFLVRRAALDPDRRRDMAGRLVERFRPHLGDAEGQPVALLLGLFESERSARERGVAARGATGAAREQHAIVARGATRWNAFAVRLAEAQRRGLAAMSPREVSEFVAAYRELATDLARLRTATHGRDVDALFHLSRLVGAGHNLLYRQRGLSMQGVLRYFTVAVPREIRRSAFPIGFAALLLFGPLAVTWVSVVRDPPLAGRILGPRMVDRVTAHATAAKKSQREYVSVSDFERPLMATWIFRNNVQIAFMVFVGGITAGLLTLVSLVLNGVMIGAGFGLYMTHGVFHQIGEFVLAHSVFELSAICISAGAGFLIAAGILLPGPRTRREALVVNGRRAIKLVAAAALLLFFAGLIEGLISPRTDIPIAVKWVVAALCLTALGAWISIGRGAGRDEGPRELYAYSDDRALMSR